MLVALTPGALAGAHQRGSKEYEKASAVMHRTAICKTFRFQLHAFKLKNIFPLHFTRSNQKENNVIKKHALAIYSMASKVQKQQIRRIRSSIIIGTKQKAFTKQIKRKRLESRREASQYGRSRRCCRGG
jgi:hypothetical protein